MPDQRPSAPAFTLIELLIVVAIIGILAAIAIPNFQNARIRAHVGRAHADLRALVLALESYNADYGVYVPLFQTKNWKGNYDPNSITSHRILPLTTPTPYITSIPPESFDLRRQIPNLNADTYAYGDRPTYDKAFWTSYFEKVDRHKYSIRSIGPDRSFNILEPVFPFILPYDATNGLKSRGDITYWGPGTGFEAR